MFADEELVMELLVNAGQARSDADGSHTLCRAKRLAGRNSANGQFLNPPVFRRIRFRPR